MKLLADDIFERYGTTNNEQWGGELGADSEQDMFVPHANTFFSQFLCTVHPTFGTRIEVLVCFWLGSAVGCWTFARQLPILSWSDEIVAFWSKVVTRSE